MSNQYFQFKQFKIEQAHCAMKVCTDACLFGAWVVELLTAQNASKQIQILDIGTGTGLLSLMTAQEINCAIDAIEIDKATANQATQNILAATFSSKIKIIQSDIKNWDSQNAYDCIISNPPFFENDLASPDHKKNLALHSAALNLKELASIIEKKLTEDGIATILLPFHRKETMIQLAHEKGLKLFAKADIKQTPTHPPFRTFLAFSRNAKTLQPEEIIIQNNRVYTERFIQLLENYYLAF
jgi:tRNA1Val (adenine37-N6)-methyltransferase